MKQGKLYSLIIVILATSLFFPFVAFAKTNMGTINMNVGETRTLTSEPSSYYTVSGDWSKTGSAISLSSPSNRSCKVTAVQAGTATVEWVGWINTTWEEMYWTINVTGILVTEITLNKTSLSLQPGQKETLSVTVKPDNASNKSYSEESNNTSVATISLGTITAKSPGQATITFKAKDGSGVSATCKVTVEGEVPVPSDLLQGDIKQVSTGLCHTMIVMSDGSLWACGRNDYGQLCDSTTESISTPKKVMDGVEYVAAGIYYTMFIKTDGSLWACGKNQYGQLGDRTTTNRSSPVKVMDDVSTVSANYYHTMIVKTDGSLWVCGYNEYYQLGDGTSYNRSTPKQILTDVKAVSTGYWHSLALKTDGSLWVWGQDDRGQLAGAKITSDNSTRVPEKVMTGVSAISAGENYTMIIKSDGTLWACGSNDYGQLALNNGTTYTNNRTVKQVMAGVAAVSAGYSHTMIVKKDGTLWACGSNYFGQLGDGTNTNLSSAKQVMSGVKDVAAGFNLTMILMKDGTLWACGSNDYGQLGDGTKVDRHSPVQISEPTIKVTSITLNKTTLSLEKGQSETLGATVIPDNATDKSVSWTLDNDMVATVDSDGKVTALSVGTTTIICTANDGSGVHATCNVTVIKPEGIDVDATNFPDENFRNFLLSKDYGQDGVLTESEISGITYIGVYSKNINSLKGIEYFTALNKLDCSGNHLTSLDISKNLAIKELFCQRNQLTNLDVSKNYQMEFLWCSDNNITSLDVSNNTTMTKLWCSRNQLYSLDVSNNPILTDLQCSDLKLTSLEVSNNKALTLLNCSNNQINGMSMDNLISCLPRNMTSDVHYFRVIDSTSENEGNVCTKTQVAAARAKGWTPQSYKGSEWLEYEGIDNPKPQKISLPTDAIVEIGKTITLTPEITPEEAETSLTWATDDSTIAKVTQKGVVKGLKEGTAIISVTTDNGLSAECFVEVIDPNSGINDIQSDSGVSSPVFTLSGQRLAAPRKGVNIVGGKKVVVK